MNWQVLGIVTGEEEEGMSALETVVEKAVSKVGEFAGGEEETGAVQYVIIIGQQAR